MKRTFRASVNGEPATIELSVDGQQIEPMENPNERLYSRDDLALCWIVATIFGMFSGYFIAQCL